MLLIIFGIFFRKKGINVVLEPSPLYIVFIVRYCLLVNYALRCQSYLSDRTVGCGYPSSSVWGMGPRFRSSKWDFLFRMVTSGQGVSIRSGIGLNRD